jgi:tetratricopeptide (TPR) repeat protein
MLGILRRSILVMLVAAAAPIAAFAQDGSASRDAVSEAAAKLLNDGRVNEARILLARALRATTDPDQQDVYRLDTGDAYLFDGQYREAARTYNAVLTGRAGSTNDNLARRADRGLALVDAFQGRSARAATHYAAALRGAGLRDTIEMLVLTNQHDSAMKALDRLAASSSDRNTTQFAQAFRGLSWMMAGHCTQALPEIAKAPDQNRPIPLAVRGRCAMKHGQRTEALALRDSVLKQPVPDPYASPMLIARDAARKIE